MKKTDGISRRDFLKGAAAGAASLAVMGLGGGVAYADDGADDVMTAAKSLSTKWEFEIPPAPIPEDQIAEVIEDDIIVIGSGMSGLTTAYSAAENGASVTLFSASSGPISRGGSNFAKYSKVCEARGIKPFDVTKYFYNEMRAASFQVDQKKWNRGYNNSEEAMNWLIATTPLTAAPTTPTPSTPRATTRWCPRASRARSRAWSATARPRA